MKCNMTFSGHVNTNQHTMHMLAQGDQNEVQHDVWGHMMPLPPVLEPHDANAL